METGSLRRLLGKIASNAEEIPLGTSSMRVIYLDCASGISGDMMLGALVDAGADLNVIQQGVSSLGLPDVRLEHTEVKRHAFRAAKINVVHPPEHAHRHLHHIHEMIDQSALTQVQQELARAIFQRLGEAEAKVHGTTIRKVHFHEVGAVDSIADIVGVAIGLDLLAPARVVCSPIPTGHGFIQIAHGRCSIPAPATAELLTGVPLAESVVSAELTTPTGAAIVSTVAEEFGSLPAMKIERIGYGAGDADFKEQANLLRLVVGKGMSSSATHLETDRITVMETNLDDVTGEVIGHTSQKLMEAGALDVYATPIYMKKNRPAVKLSVLCDDTQAGELEQLLFTATRTLGIRRWNADRRILKREPSEIDTPWGSVKGKRVVLPDGSCQFLPEFEDCRRLAEQENMPVQEVIECARQQAVAT